MKIFLTKLFLARYPYAYLRLLNRSITKKPKKQFGDFANFKLSLQKKFKKNLQHILSIERYAPGLFRLRYSPYTLFSDSSKYGCGVKKEQGAIIEYKNLEYLM